MLRVLTEGLEIAEDVVLLLIRGAASTGEPAAGVLSRTVVILNWLFTGTERADSLFRVLLLSEPEPERVRAGGAALPDPPLLRAGAGVAVPEPDLVRAGAAVPDPVLVRAGAAVPEPVRVRAGAAVPEPVRVRVGAVVPDPVLVRAGAAVPEPVRVRVGAAVPDPVRVRAGAAVPEPVRVRVGAAVPVPVRVRSGAVVAVPVRVRVRVSTPLLLVLVREGVEVTPEPALRVRVPILPVSDLSRVRVACVAMPDRVLTRSWVTAVLEVRSRSVAATDLSTPVRVRVTLLPLWLTEAIPRFTPLARGPLVLVTPGRL
jgi:hypothetical protein